MQMEMKKDSKHNLRINNNTKLEHTSKTKMKRQQRKTTDSENERERERLFNAFFHPFYQVIVSQLCNNFKQSLLTRLEERTQTHNLHTLTLLCSHHKWYIE